MTIRENAFEATAENKVASRGPYPLSGIRVLDLAQWEAGSTCGQSLGFMGADVLKIERPQGGDPARIASADSADSDSIYFLVLNANKRGVTIDLQKQEGKELLRKLIRESDILLENFAPGTIEKLGFSYKDVSEINPRIIYGSIQGFSDVSPYRDFKCFDAIAQSMGGSVSCTGEAGGPPIKPGPTFADTGSGLHLTIGLLAALYQREVTGKGQRIKVAMQEAIVNFERLMFARHQVSGKPFERVGNGSPSSTSSPSGLYATKGGSPNDYCFVYTARDEFTGNKQWNALLKTIGRTDLANDPRFATPEARFQNSEDVDGVIMPWMLTQEKRTAMELLNHAGVPAGAVYDTGDLMNDPSLRATGMLSEVTHPQRGRVVIPGWPVKMSGSDVMPVKCPPLLGEHTSSVLRETLGLSDSDIDELRISGAI